MGKDRNRPVRVAARRRVHDRLDRQGCPRPDKPAYDLADAAETRLAEQRGGPGMDLYLCRCGFAHHGHPAE